jgi:cytoskeleton protein RodZ
MTTDAASPHLEPETAGLLLRRAREAAGLSLDAVAQQLKLAPRQVEALEEGDFSRLPGRTFVRGFMRNYARLLHLDAERVLSALPGGAAAPSLEAPTLHATSQSIGELPMADGGKSTWSRWLIPLALIGVVAGAALYEYNRQAGVDGSHDGTPTTSTPATKGIGDAGTTPLPNPLANDPSAAAPQEPGTGPSPHPSPAGGKASSDTTADASSPSPQPTPPSGTGSREAAGPDQAAPPSAQASAASVSAPPPAAEEATVVFTYRDFSWTEVRDRSGRVLVARMMKGGEKQTLSGVPPLEVVIGNASDVKLTYRGQPVDLAPLSRGNVARFTLK